MATSFRKVCRLLLSTRYGQFRSAPSKSVTKFPYTVFLAQFHCSFNNFGPVLKTAKHRTSNFYRPRNVSVFVSSGLLGFLGLEKEDKEDELVLTIKRSILLIQKGELNKAEQMLHLALKLAQQRQDQDGITYVYDLLANLALEKGELAKAEKLFVGVMQRLMTIGVKQDDNRIIHVSLKLAQMHSESGKDKGGSSEKAEEGFRFCLERLQKKVKPGSAEENDEDTVLLLALAEEAYARFCLSQDRLVESQKHLELAAAHLLHGIDLGTRSPDGELRTALMLNDLGSLCSLNGDQEAAVRHLARAIECGERGAKMRREARSQLPKGVMGDEELVASLRINLGVVYAKMGMYELAQESCLAGWKAAKRLKQEEVLSEANSCLDEVKKLIGQR
ncbi:tetratricopeptide repeat protein 19 homolog, mitochondrial [Hetaerina americana]|uniref:tetratricopeptide repeat protein 19 homolog, mitochondrial n=1 Tax=Hetaerina americana TaxID=62018 RepID=UPI003A7F1C90